MTKIISQRPRPLNQKAINVGGTEINSSDASPSYHDLCSPVEQATEACYSANGGKGLFASKEAVLDVLALCYSLAVELTKGGERACIEALEHTYFENRERRPSADKPFLIAMQLGAKPHDPATHKATSDYACILEAADDSDVDVAAFAEWFGETNLTACKHAVREKRKAAKDLLKPTQAPPPATPAVDTNNLPPLLGDGIVLPSFLRDAIKHELQKSPPITDGDYLDALTRAIDAARATMEAEDAS